MKVSTLLLFEVEDYWKRKKIGDLEKRMKDKMLPEFLMIERNVELLAIYL